MSASLPEGCETMHLCSAPVVEAGEHSFCGRKVGKRGVRALYFAGEEAIVRWCLDGNVLCSACIEAAAQRLRPPEDRQQKAERLRVLQSRVEDLSRRLERMRAGTESLVAYTNGALAPLLHELAAGLRPDWRPEQPIPEDFEAA